MPIDFNVQGDDGQFTLDERQTTTATSVGGEGNDLLIGGDGVDYGPGGFGNDLLNADDVHRVAGRESLEHAGLEVVVAASTTDTATPDIRDGTARETLDIGDVLATENPGDDAGLFLPAVSSARPAADDGPSPGLVLGSTSDAAPMSAMDTASLIAGADIIG